MDHSNVDMLKLILLNLSGKGIRLLIQAVSKYRNSSVELITYSMGVVISRKAVLGGACTDTKENLEHL
uniref:Uncharacterized protein n=1 Tax=Ditylenchus dipsaci TaxID=166011 RepID=A0A915E7Z4_9BILA